MNGRDDLVIVAVSRYADACPEDLHVDCPFAEPSLDGGRKCDEQCRSVARSYTRAGRSEPTANFDAGLILMQDMDGAQEPSASWQLASLLLVLRRVAESRPFDLESGTTLHRRKVDATSALAALNNLGWDFDALLRAGLGPVISSRLTTLLMPEVRATLRARGFNDHTRLRAWDDVVDTTDSASVREYLDNWLQFSTLDDILEWRAPRVTEFLGETPALQPDQANAYLWVVDRLTQTYLSDWSMVALQSEYSFRFEGWRPDWIPLEQVAAQREVPEGTLAKELGSRLLGKRWGTPIGLSRSDPEALSELIRDALAWISEGRPDVAAASFEGALRISPDDADLANNLAFCLIPSDPGRAIDLLDRAAVSGYARSDVLSCNRALAQGLCGEYEASLETIEGALAALGPEASQLSAYLWSLSGLPTNWEVVEVVPSVYLWELKGWLQEKRPSGSQANQ